MFVLIVLALGIYIGIVIDSLIMTVVDNRQRQVKYRNVNILSLYRKYDWTAHGFRRDGYTVSKDPWYKDFDIE